MTGGTERLCRLCADAAAVGADALWAVDHLFWEGPLLEPLLVLTLAAASTRRAVLGTAVLQLPLRRPAAVAKQAATLQLLSGGRLVLGLGTGSHRVEYDAAGADFDGRGGALDRGVADLRRCWSGEREGGRYPQLPTPAPIPIFFGGSSPAALQRTAAVGDGWIPMFISPDGYRVALDQLRSQTVMSGRDPSEVFPAVLVMVRTGPDRGAARDAASSWLASVYGLPGRAFARHVLAGPARLVAAEIERYRDAGAAHVAVMVAGDDPLDHAADLLDACQDVHHSPHPDALAASVTTRRSVS